MIERLDQALLIHAQIGDVEILDAVGDIVQERVVDLVVHIADDDVAFAFAAHGHRLGDEIRGADAAANQRGVEDDRLDKAVLTAAQHLVILGLRGGALRIGAHIKGDGGGEALGDQAGDAAEHVFDDLVGLIDNADLDIGNTVAAEFFGGAEISGFGVIVKEFHQLFHDVVLDQSVDVEDDGFLARDDDVALDDVEAVVTSKKVGELFAVGFIG